MLTLELELPNDVEGAVEDVINTLFSKVDGEGVQVVVVCEAHHTRTYLSLSDERRELVQYACMHSIGIQEGQTVVTSVQKVLPAKMFNKELLDDVCTDVFRRGHETANILASTVDAEAQFPA